MNEALFFSEQAKSQRAALSGGIAADAVITGIRLDDGSYHVLSRFSDPIWRLPDSLFAAGVRDNHKILNFARVPVVFQGILRACMARYILVGVEGGRRPRGSTIIGMFGFMACFLDWLDARSVNCLNDVTPLLTQQYVEFCKGLKYRPDMALSPRGLVNRFQGVERLHQLSKSSADPMEHPWPESSASHLAGLTGRSQVREQTAKTEVIPDDVLGLMFRSSVEWLNRADEIAELSEQVEYWRSEGHNHKLISARVVKHGLTLNKLNAAKMNLQTACMCVILTTSGVRVSELCSLENQCAFTTQDEYGEPFHWMRGRSEKTGAGACQWLVAEIAHRAIAVAERLAQPLQQRLANQVELLSSNNIRDPDAVRLNGHLERLFLVINKKKKNRIETISIENVLIRLNRFASDCAMDWKFAPHQFRRTFAVYAAHSALGDLRYLRDHYKHWSLDMTTLYAMNREQDAELYDEVGHAALGLKIGLLENWLEPDAILTGGGAEPIRAFRAKSEGLATKANRTEMAKTISPLVHLRATGAGWCTADTGGCNGGQSTEKTRCGDCHNAVIDESRKPFWRGVYAQQLELRQLPDIGPAGAERVERDIARCETVLRGLGATDEEFANVAT